MRKNLKELSLLRDEIKKLEHDLVVARTTSANLSEEIEKGDRILAHLAKHLFCKLDKAIGFMKRQHIDWNGTCDNWKSRKDNAEELGRNRDNSLNYEQFKVDEIEMDTSETITVDDDGNNCPFAHQDYHLICTVGSLAPIDQQHRYCNGTLDTKCPIRIRKISVEVKKIKHERIHNGKDQEEKSED